MKNIFLFLQDSTKTEKLDEVLVKAVRVSADSPITHSNVSKEELAKRNLGQDIPILLNFGVGTSTNGSGAFGASLNLLTDAFSEEASGEIANSFGRN